MQQVAQGLASLGRGDDSMLVHMTPGEVQGLQKLAMSAGGSLTINPHTGLAEAGFLSSMLPMLAAAAAVAATGGAAGAGLLGMGAGATGALAGGATGYFMDPKRKLSSAITGGLSGYGASGLMGGLEAAGGTAIGNDAVLNESLARSGDIGAETIAAQETARQTAIQNATFGEKLTSGLGSNPLAFAKGNLGSLAAASAPLVSNMLQQPTLASLPKQNVPYQTYNYNPGEVNPNFGQPGNTDPYFLDQGYTRTGAEGGLFHNTADEAYPQARLPLQHMAGGGDIYGDDKGAGIHENNSTKVEDMIARYEKAVRMLEAKRKKTEADDDTEYAAHGGLMGLNEYAAGGKLLRGAGDGMSDSIPAVIKGERPQRAALADGEFVIPADVVSHLGNGSTEAGAKRLYAMMDKVRHARTGNKKQGRQINPERFMPA